MATARLSNLEKYIRLYAEADTEALKTLPPREPWSKVLVVPACNEMPRFLNSAPTCPGRSLMILVVNQDQQATPVVSAANQALAETVQKKFNSLWRTSTGLELLCDPDQPRDVLLVDRFSQGRQLPVKGGVGHARKVGVDLAATLFQNRLVLSPWIHCSDADVQLPETYFSCTANRVNGATECSALVYPFRHCSLEDGDVPEDVLLATRLYEFALHYYVAGLRHAGSPYAFHTIGSTMAINVHSYAKVRGFPRREAGEDFYLLNKLAKVGRVHELVEGPGCHAIRIACRRSDRVPFGTGAAVNTISGLGDPVRDYRYYHPGVFELLKVWLETWSSIWCSGSNEIARAIPQEMGHNFLQGDSLPVLVEGLKAIKAEQALEHAFRQSGELDQFTRQMHTWFDAFRTLKLIHFLRDHGLPSVNLAQLRRNKAFLDYLENNQTLADLILD